MPDPILIRRQDFVSDSTSIVSLKSAVRRLKPTFQSSRVIIRLLAAGETLESEQATYQRIKTGSK